MYKKCYSERVNPYSDLKHIIHLWDENGYSTTEWDNIAYQKCKEGEHTARGLNGEYLKPISNWYYSNNP